MLLTGWLENHELNIIIKHVDNDESMKCLQLHFSGGFWWKQDLCLKFDCLLTNLDWFLFLDLFCDHCLEWEQTFCLDFDLFLDLDLFLHIDLIFSLNLDLFLDLDLDLLFSFSELSAWAYVSSLLLDDSSMAYQEILLFLYSNV